MREDKHPIQRVLDVLDEVGARFLALWLTGALLSLLAVVLALISG